MKIQCYDKGTGLVSLTIEFPSERHVHTVLTGYAFETPHDVYVDGTFWGEWHYPLVVVADQTQIPE